MATVCETLILCIAISQMGSIVSGFGSSNVPDPITGLTPREQKLVQSSWALFQRNPVDNGVELFMRLFEVHPEHIQWFPFRDVPLASLRDNKLLQIHATSVMYALNAIINSLDSSEVLVNLLVKTGLSHGERGVSEQGFWDLKTALLDALRSRLDYKFTPEVAEAWNKVLDVAFKVVVEHINLAQEEEDNSSATNAIVG